MNKETRELDYAKCKMRDFRVYVLWAPSRDRVLGVCLVPCSYSAPYAADTKTMALGAEAVVDRRCEASIGFGIWGQ